MDSFILQIFRKGLLSLNKEFYLVIKVVVGIWKVEIGTQKYMYIYSIYSSTIQRFQHSYFGDFFFFLPCHTTDWSKTTQHAAASPKSGVFTLPFLDGSAGHQQKAHWVLLKGCLVIFWYLVDVFLVLLSICLNCNHVVHNIL